MKNPTSEYRDCERIVARLLRGGTWLASIVIAAGLSVETLHFAAAPRLHGYSAFDIVNAGIAAFIFLPIARVALMLAFFLHKRDYLYTAISALVLAIIWTGLVARL